MTKYPSTKEIRNSNFEGLMQLSGEDPNNDLSAVGALAEEEIRVILE